LYTLSQHGELAAHTDYLDAPRRSAGITSGNYSGEAP
jgi:hypothetical protein